MRITTRRISSLPLEIMMRKEMKGESLMKKSMPRLMSLWNIRVLGVVLIFLTVINLNTRAAATIQKGKITNPRVAAQRLYNAWKTKSKKAGLKVATAEAVSKLFSVKWRPMKFKGCQNTGGSFECIYTDAKIDLDVAMIVEGGASAGYHVESVSFSSEAAFLPAARTQLTTLSSIISWESLLRGSETHPR
jgi:hypothetical protein